MTSVTLDLLEKGFLDAHNMVNKDTESKHSPKKCRSKKRRRLIQNPGKTQISTKVQQSTFRKTKNWRKKTQRYQTAGRAAAPLEQAAVSAISTPQRSHPQSAELKAAAIVILMIIIIVSDPNTS